MHNRPFTLMWLLAGVSLALVTGCLNWLAPTPRAMPDELREASVLIGGEVLDKQDWFTSPSIGKVTDIRLVDSPDIRIGIAGLNGAVWLTSDRDVASSVTFKKRLAHVEFVDIDGDGEFEFLDRGGRGWQDASLLDSSGRTLWTRGGMPGVNDMAAGDFDGDGAMEFVVGFNGGGGIHRLDRQGRKVWDVGDSNVWSVTVIDTDGDGTPEIVHSNAAGQITVRDATGRVIQRSRPSVYFSHFSLCRWPVDTDSTSLLLVDDNAILLLDFAGKTVGKFDAPLADRLAEAYGAPIRFAADQPAHLAVLVEFDNWRRSVLYVFDEAGTLVYQEVIGEACAALATIHKDESGRESLLIGGSGRVWEYTLHD